MVNLGGLVFENMEAKTLMTIHSCKNQSLSYMMHKLYFIVLTELGWMKDVIES